MTEEWYRGTCPDEGPVSLEDVMHILAVPAVRQTIIEIVRSDEMKRRMELKDPIFYALMIMYATGVPDILYMEKVLEKKPRGRDDFKTVAKFLDCLDDIDAEDSVFKLIHTDCALTFHNLANAIRNFVH